MHRRAIGILSIVLMLTSSGGGAAESKKSDFLRIHLPREVVIEDEVPNLGQVGVIFGDESLVAKASKIALGRISVPGQEVTIDRRVVLSRLACNGIPASKVKLTGAEKIKVRQRSAAIRSEEFVKLARALLDKAALPATVCERELMRTPQDLTVEGTGKDIRVVPRLVRTSVPNQVRVRLSVLADGKELGYRDVGFRLKYNCQKVVTLVDIPAGAVINPENVRVEKTVSNYPAAAGWTVPYGLVAKRPLQADTVIRSNMVGPAEPPVIVKRNQNVVIRIAAGGLVVTVMGRTVQEGRAGEFIKVRNTDSQRIILAKVKENGTVEPVF